MKSVLIIAPLTFDACERYAQAAAELGVEACFAIPGVSNIPYDTWQLDRYRTICVERIDNDATALIEALASFGHIDAVVAGGEFSVAAADSVARALGLRCSMDGDPSVLRNKARMRHAFAQHGVPQPRLYGAASSIAELRELIVDIDRYPVVSKPADMAGSWYVTLNHSADEIERNAAAIFADRVALSTGMSFAGECLLEAYFHGDEYSAEVVVQDARIEHLFVTRKFLSPLPNFDEIGHLSGPALLEGALRAQVEDAARRLLDAARVRNSIVHIEFKVSPDGTMAVIEAGCRVAGDRISTLVNLAFGVNLEKAMITVKLGSDLAAARADGHQPSCYGVRFAFAGQPAADVPGARVLQKSIEPDHAPIDGFSRTHLVNRIGYEVLQVPSAEQFAVALQG
ncbi:hypothetical protein WK68_11650 [Burkholderia ubonensis]|uniref:ATP-grasp domain-containing protein n=1 Tax=Burkholderia ubonensis TaxID=101571 RepID=UPI000759FD1C|nr:ATP-grasp domain-containing protein [Burkholderia ubonensis]KVN84112.1 hypothetical protein WJ67_33350 [Burkholderia ubonensis]KVO30251.1 hypothetical protein WJ75_27930 [Burkholderia ubonensis]KVU41789.1 hypothetical protein WK68_11650 [Burkholderia ubonensis]